MSSINEQTPDAFYRLEKPFRRLFGFREPLLANLFRRAFLAADERVGKKGCPRPLPASYQCHSKQETISPVDIRYIRSFNNLSTLATVSPGFTLPGTISGNEFLE